MSETETGPQTEPTEPTTPEPEPEPEPEEVEEAEQEEAPPPDAKESEARIERGIKALAKENTRHANRISEILGEDAQALEVCPLCWENAPGFVWPAEGGFPGEPQRSLVRAFLGDADQTDLLAAEDAQACETCNAMGVTLTGSKVEAQRTKPCAKCNGTGWVPKYAPQPPPVLPVSPEAPTGAYAPNGGQPIAADRWGRPAGHPHYGREPASVGA